MPQTFERPRHASLLGKQPAASWLDILAVTLLGLFFAPVFLNSLLFLLGFPIWFYSLDISVVLVFLGAIILSRAPVCAVFALCLGVLCVWASGWFFDASWDGIAYHQTAVVELARGLNPAYSVFTNWSSDLNNNFPKASWIFGATLYSRLGDIQFGKAYTLIVLLATLAYSLHAFRRQSPTVRALGFLACLNPVILCQVFTYYVDGAMASLTTILVFYAWRTFREEERLSNAEHTLAAMSTILICGLKFTGVVYTVIVVGILALCLLLRRAMPEFKALVRRVAVPTLIGVCIVGFNPYITHLLSGRHIFHPIAGKDRIGVMTYNSPAGFLEKDRLSKLAISIFSRSAHVNASRTAQLKPPFVVYPGEWEAFESYDLRIGGFGALFSGILLCSLALALWRPRDISPWTLVLLTALTLVNPEAWWARYAPFIWLIPFFLAMGARVPGWARGGLMLLVLLNLFMLTRVSVSHQLRWTNALRKALEPNAHKTCWVYYTQYFDFQPTAERYDITLIPEPHGYTPDGETKCLEMVLDARLCCPKK